MFLSEVYENYNIKYKNTFYHYPTGFDTIGFHLHIVPKLLPNSGYNPSYSHQLSRYYWHDYYKFDINIWPKIHHFICSIHCTHTFVEHNIDKIKQLHSEVNTNIDLFDILMGSIKEYIHDQFGITKDCEYTIIYLKELIKYNYDHIKKELIDIYEKYISK